MKKFIYSAAAMALAFFAASCQQENHEPVATDNTVTYTVQVSESAATKALGDDLNAVNKVYYQVYRAGEVDELAKEFVYDGYAKVNSGKASFDLEFVKNQNFVVLFWAQNEDLQMFDIADLRKVTLTNPGYSNNANAQVFAGSDTVTNCNSAVGGKVTLTRPVSQLNIATNAESLAFGIKTIDLVSSTVTVTGLYPVYNVAKGEVSGTSAAVTYADAEIFEETLTVGGNPYTYAAMNYVGFAPEAGATVDVDFTITTSEGDVQHSVSSVPVKPNYRTNIIGNLITDATDYNITLNNWAEAEITHAYDAAAAQNALDNAVEGSVIQLHPGVNYGTLYMRPVAGGAQTKVVDWIGNNYGFETYSLFKNITILGAEGATVDAIVIEGGTYYHTNHSQKDLYPVMLSLVELKNVVIDGVTFTGKGGYDPQGYGNAVNLSGSNIKVDSFTFKNCVLNNSENKARLLYKTESTTHVYNYSYDGETYTFSPSLKDITITGCTLNGGYMGLELRETENVTITNNEFNVGDRNILLAVNTGCTYTGKITITGNVSNNAKERFVRADGTGDAEVIIKNNTINNYQSADADYIKVTGGNNVTIENNQCNNFNTADVASAQELASAVNNATKDIVVTLTDNIEGKITLYQKDNIKVTIDGNNKTYTGAIQIFGNNTSTNYNTTIKNINFVAKGFDKDAEGCIYTIDNSGSMNPCATNVTIEDCTFTSDPACDRIYAAIRQNSGGQSKDWTITRCTVDATMHSFLQVKNNLGYLNITECNVYSKNGVNLNRTANASFTKCNFDVMGYAVRLGDGTSTINTNTLQFNFKDCYLKSANDDGDAVVIIRQDSQNATLNFVNTNLIGTPQISGVVDGKTTINGLQ